MTLFSCETTEKLIMTKWYELVFNPLDNLAFDDTETQIQHLGLFFTSRPKGHAITSSRPADFYNFHSEIQILKEHDQKSNNPMSAACCTAGRSGGGNLLRPRG